MAKADFINMLNIIVSVSLAFLGISATLYTVVYAFMADKVDKLKHLLNRQKLTKKLTIFEERELYLVRIQIRKYKSLSKLISYAIGFSFVSFLISFTIQIAKWYNATFFIWLGLVFFIISLIFFVFVMLQLHKRFNKDIKL